MNHIIIQLKLSSVEWNRKDILRNNGCMYYAIIIENKVAANLDILVNAESSGNFEKRKVANSQFWAIQLQENVVLPSTSPV